MTAHANLIQNAWLRTLEDGITTGDLVNAKGERGKAGTDEFASAVIARLGDEPNSALPRAAFRGGERELRDAARAEAARQDPRRRGRLRTGTRTVGIRTSSVRRVPSGPRTRERRLSIVTNRGVKVYPGRLPPRPSAPTTGAAVSPNRTAGTSPTAPAARAHPEGRARFHQDRAAPPFRRRARMVPGAGRVSGGGAGHGHAASPGAERDAPGARPAPAAGHRSTCPSTACGSPRRRRPWRRTSSRRAAPRARAGRGAGRHGDRADLDQPVFDDGVFLPLHALHRRRTSSTPSTASPRRTADASISLMATRGLRSVILIGGGADALPGLQRLRRVPQGPRDPLSVVTNGSRGDRLLEVVERLDERDDAHESRLGEQRSLRGHAQAHVEQGHPRRHLRTRSRSSRPRDPAPRIGFSYIIVWSGARAMSTLYENIHEIVMVPSAPAITPSTTSPTSRSSSARRAVPRSWKRAKRRRRSSASSARIRAEVERAKEAAGASLDVYESTNLRMLEDGSWRSLTAQPKVCYMQALRQVLTPMGVYNCPAHRGVDKAKLGEKDAYAGSTAPPPRGPHRRPARQLRREPRVQGGTCPTTM